MQKFMAHFNNVVLVIYDLGNPQIQKNRKTDQKNKIFNFNPCNLEISHLPIFR